jgi:hypothetical protein
MNALPIAKSILYDKRILLAPNIKKRSFTEKIINPKVVLVDNGVVAHQRKEG